MRHCEEAEGRRGNPGTHGLMLISGSPRPRCGLAMTKNWLSPSCSIGWG